MNGRKGGFALLGVLLLTACDTGGEPELLDEATLVADAVLGDLAMMALPGVHGMGAPAASDGSVLERSRTVEFYDAEGNPMDAFDRLLTDVVHISVEVSGEVTRVAWTGSIDRERDVSVSGLAGEETARTWNGTSSGHVTRSSHSDQRGDRTYDMTEEGTIDDVVIAVDRDANPWPLSGSTTRHVSVKLTGPAGEVEREREVSVVFDGTQFVQLTVNGETFELDLATLPGHGPFRGRGGRHGG